ncbi:uncharacterized protein LOC114276448 [Camellia sinensis]|uniref:uncharacterized protein LOC114276448 n=1 Tax=Camellia sinensis TaxID=4442 RepID=UPI00103550A8|nr:uncharacterized protein LOC114276448 [Camellia sinensis]
MCKNKEEWDKFISLWNFLVLSSTELEYNEHLARLLADFDTYPEAVQYVSQSWLIPYKDKFFAVWTDSCMHFGNVTTNRAESAHAKLKRQLGSNQVNFECSWIKIHSLLELQHIDIKASFEKSLTVVQHQFKPSHFRELQGNISITALDHVLAESKRTNDVGIDASVCGCVVRRTHGLPCAHEIANYIRQGRRIPLDSINPHWRTLELEILHKLGEIVDPQSSFLIEQDVKPNPQGKGHKNINVSTRRDPCAFELVQSRHDSHSPMGTHIPIRNSVKVHRKGPGKEKVYRTHINTTYSYVDALPVGLKPYIHFIKDVDADGNCGFRAIVGLMGIEELTHILSYFKPNLGYHRWMTMPDMGHLIASCYNVVLYHLSTQQCLTFLPLRSMSISQVQRREIAIGFVNGNHFIQVFMLSGHPVPPIAINWCKFHHSCAAGWDTTYSCRIEHFKQVVHSGVTTIETFDCINLDE